MARWCSLILICLFMAGCRFLEISDEQAEAIAVQAGQVATAAAQAGGDALAPGAGAGIGALAGLVIAAVSRSVLQLLRKKPE